jgi:hypothetical protein
MQQTPDTRPFNRSYTVAVASTCHNPHSTNYRVVDPQGVTCSPRFATYSKAERVAANMNANRAAFEGVRMPGR